MNVYWNCHGCNARLFAGSPSKHCAACARALANAEAVRRIVARTIWIDDRATAKCDA